MMKRQNWTNTNETQILQTNKAPKLSSGALSTAIAESPFSLLPQPQLLHPSSPYLTLKELAKASLVFEITIHTYE